VQSFVMQSILVYFSLFSSSSHLRVVQGEEIQPFQSWNVLRVAEILSYDQGVSNILTTVVQ
jgi:hypothetical protein